MLMTFFTLVSLTVGFWFYFIGAWPVLGFFGLDVALLYFAFRASYRTSASYETVLLTERDLDITRHPLRGEAKNFRFDPYWVKLQLLERRGRSCLLQASSHGRQLVFGEFLSDGEKRELAHKLHAALALLRSH